MPLYMDRHEVSDESTPSDIAEAHLRDLRTQAKSGVDFITYWFDHRSGGGFCLVEGPSAEAVEAVHREAHGDLATKIIEVDRSAVEGFWAPLPGRPRARSSSPRRSERSCSQTWSGRRSSRNGSGTGV